MKKKNKIIALSLVSVFAIAQTGCMGSFGLTNSLYSWNEGATGNKFVNNLIFWAFLIIPVYEVTLFIDAVILNLIEFWSGSNPTAMEEGEVETQIVEKDGVTYLMKATKNNFEVTTLDGDKKGEKLHLTYIPEESTWNKVEADGKIQKLVKYNEETAEVTLFKPNGQSITVKNDMDSFTAVSKQLKAESTYMWASAE